MQIAAPTCTDGVLISKKSSLQGNQGITDIYTFFKKHTVTRTTGRLCHDSYLLLSHFDEEIDKLNYQNLDDCYTYHYNINYIVYSWKCLIKKQSLQFVTESVDIPTDYQGCSKGELSFKHMVQKSHPLLYSFCGKYASVTHYSSNKQVDIKLWYYFKQNIYVDILFTVLDPNILETFVLKYSAQGPKYLVHNAIAHVAWLYLLNIYVAKHKRVCATRKETQRTRMKFYDGPGSFSFETNFLNHPDQGMKHCFSTFQCFIHVYANHFESIGTFLNFSEDDLKPNFKKKLNALNSTIKISGHPCPKRDAFLCIFLIQVVPWLFLNVTIEDLAYSGKLTTGCNFGGISFLQRNKLSSLTEITTVCDNISSSLHRSIDSDDNSMLVVIYSYSKYSNISVKLSVSETTCQIGIFDIFKIKALCCLNPDSKNCIDQLANIFDDLKIRDNVLRQTIGTGDCRILQFGKNFQLSKRYFSEMQSFVFSCLRIQILSSNWQKQKIKLTYRGIAERSKIVNSLDLNFHVRCSLLHNSIKSSTGNQITTETSGMFGINYEIPHRFEGAVDEITVCGFSQTASWTEIIIRSIDFKNTYQKETLGPHKGQIKTVRVVLDATLVFKMGDDILSQCLVQNALSQEIKPTISMLIEVNIRQIGGSYMCSDWIIHPLLSCHDPVHFVSIEINEAKVFEIRYIYTISPPSNISAFWIRDKPGFRWKVSYLGKQIGQQSMYESTSRMGKYKLFILSDQMTWTEAHEYCREKNGSLPNLLDKADLEELVLIMKAGRNFDDLYDANRCLIIGLKVIRNDCS